MLFHVESRTLFRISISYSPSMFEPSPGTIAVRRPAHHFLSHIIPCPPVQWYYCYVSDSRAPSTTRQTKATRLQRQRQRQRPSAIERQALDGFAITEGAIASGSRRLPWPQWWCSPWAGTENRRKMTWDRRFRRRESRSDMGLTGHDLSLASQMIWARHSRLSRLILQLFPGGLAFSWSVVLACCCILTTSPLIASFRPRGHRIALHRCSFDSLNALLPRYPGKSPPPQVPTRRGSAAAAGRQRPTTGSRAKRISSGTACLGSVGSPLFQLLHPATRSISFPASPPTSPQSSSSKQTQSGPTTNKSGSSAIVPSTLKRKMARPRHHTHTHYTRRTSSPQVGVRGVRTTRYGICTRL